MANYYKNIEEYRSVTWLGQLIIMIVINKTHIIDHVTYIVT